MSVRRSVHARIPCCRIRIHYDPPDGTNIYSLRYAMCLLSRLDVRRENGDTGLSFVSSGKRSVPAIFRATTVEIDTAKGLQNPSHPRPGTIVITILLITARHFFQDRAVLGQTTAYRYILLEERNSSLRTSIHLQCRENYFLNVLQIPLDYFSFGFRE